MTAQGEDILAWLENAISEREQAAHRACDGGEGRWRRGWCPEDELEEGETNGAGVSDERDRTIVYDEGRPSIAQSNHIVLNDPAAVLRRCAADRKLLALHNTPSEVFPDGGYLDDNRWCVGCGYGNDGEPLTLDVKDCPSLNALAEGYGWTGGER